MVSPWSVRLKNSAVLAVGLCFVIYFGLRCIGAAFILFVIEAIHGCHASGLWRMESEWLDQDSF
jgi:hypothetical protein